MQKPSVHLRLRDNDARIRYREWRSQERAIDEPNGEIPDDVAHRLRAEGGDLSRRALEALVAEEYRLGRLSKPDLRRLLGFTTSDQIDTFLKAHEVWIDYTIVDLERERAGLRHLGF
ncbi:MAG: UPF0175 family protein [Bryobacteraceae bacterium]|nr:UPF0175 family protein [Bryobacteraceae bacterium]